MKPNFELRGERKSAPPCKNCGCEERYVKDGSCPVCRTERTQKWANENHSRYEALQSANSRKRKWGIKPLTLAETQTRRAIEDRLMMKELGQYQTFSI